MSTKITFNQTQSGINSGNFDPDTYVSETMYSDVLPAKFLTIDPWVTATAYVIGDKVYDSVSKWFYIATVDHTSAATFAADVAKWTIYKNTFKDYTSLIDFSNDGFVQNSVDYGKHYYQVSEVFRQNPNALICVHIVKETANTYNFAEINYLIGQLKAKNTIPSGVGIYAPKHPYTLATAQAAQTVWTSVFTDYAIPLGQIYGSFNYDAYSTLADIVDINGSTAGASKFMHVLFQDGDNVGYAISSTNMGNVGAVLGLHSKTKVNQSLGDVANNLAVSNSEMRTPMLPFGQLKIDAFTNAEMKLLNDARHIVAYTEGAEVRLWNDYTQTSNLDDYDQVNRNRLWTKVERDVRYALRVLINANLEVMPGSGILSGGAIAGIKQIISAPLTALLADKYFISYGVAVDNRSKFTSTRKINAIITITPYFNADSINIDLGYVI